MEQMSKNKDVGMAKTLFECWDLQDKGVISLDHLTDYLISFGIATEKGQVKKLLQIVCDDIHSVGINLKQFVCIFSRDKFLDNAVKILKSECKLNRIED